MVSPSHDLRSLALDLAAHHPSSATPSSLHLQQQRPRRLPSSRGRTDSQSRPTLPPHRRSSSSLEDVTDAMATRHPWSIIPLPFPQVPLAPTHGQVATEREKYLGNVTPIVEQEPESAISFARTARWPDFEDEADSLPSPPKTPRPRRLRTPDLPELQHAENSGRFCSCCVRKGRRYQEGRAKMDSQR